ncbi:hypothetical protein F2Q70_00012177 [Brassica cretica]|uniref:DUF4283 domain-containing protein n=1 Tax=Brassica cretica TaxID=69181 RepID=A0A8S9LVU3_BRACR|nr:hypothetical protein F2Q70_00012177 [Brassica cretica]
MSLIDGMISECGSETSRLAGELLELQGRWSETEAMLKAVKDSHSLKVSKLEVSIGELERDLGKTASSLLKEKKARKAKSSEVLMLGPENKDEYIIEKFHKCSLPPGGLIHVVVNRIWGRSCKISRKKIGESSYMFYIPHEPTRHWVIQSGVSHIDDCLLFVLPWTPEISFKIPKLSTLPVWINLKQILDCCYSRLGISDIASGLGEPILTHKPRLDPTSMGEVKVLVEMELMEIFQR